jgi:hypothetical protein
MIFLTAAEPRSTDTCPPASIPDSRADWTVAISTTGGFDGQEGRLQRHFGRWTFPVIPQLHATGRFRSPRYNPSKVHQSGNTAAALQMPGLLMPIPVQTSPSVCLDCIDHDVAVDSRLEGSSGSTPGHGMSPRNRASPIIHANLPGSSRACKIIGRISFRNLKDSCLHRPIRRLYGQRL